MGIIFKVPAFILYAVAGLWGGFVCLALVFDNLGFILGVLSLFVAPLTLAIVPWYEGFAHENWFPIILVYGSGFSALILFSIGSAIDGD